MKSIIALIFLMTLRTSADENGWSFTSDPLLFKPLVANTFEPRMGLIWHADNNRLRLDIGNSVDLVQYRGSGGNRHITFGSDFFTYTLLRGEKNFHFPVDAVDYLFGFNANMVDSLEHGVLSARFRLSHISAHFADGHFDGAKGVWKDGLNPRVYSREFFDLTAGFEPNDRLRIYLGFIYLWHVDPTTLPTEIGYAGAEYHIPAAPLLNVFAAYQFTATGLRPRHELQIGGKIGPWKGRGTQIFFIHHSGNSIHGEYYDRSDDFSGLGFTIDFSS